MEYENSEALESARSFVLSENIPQDGNEEQVPLQTNTSSEAMIPDTSTEDTAMQDSATHTPETPPLTRGLEALLGGLEPTVSAIEENSDPLESPQVKEDKTEESGEGAPSPS